MFHRDRPEDLHLVRRVIGVDGRRSRFNLLPTPTATETTNENDALANNATIAITPANLKKHQHSSVGIRTQVKERRVGDDLTNLGDVKRQAKTPRFTKVQSLPQGSGGSKPLKNEKKAAPRFTKVQSLPQGSGGSKPLKNDKKAVPITECKSTHFQDSMGSLLIPYQQSSRFLAGTLLTYEDNIDGPDASEYTAPICKDPMGQGNPKPAVVSFFPNVSSNLIGRLSFMIAWPRPGHLKHDILSAALAVFVLEGFADKRRLCSKVKSYLTLFPEFANDFHHYDCTLRGTPSYSIIQGTLEFKYCEDSTRHIDMIHDFATYAANRLLNLPGLETSSLSHEDIAALHSVVADWKEAVHSIY
jgi:hypothetical protein